MGQVLYRRSMGYWQNKSHWKLCLVVYMHLLFYQLTLVMWPLLHHTSAGSRISGELSTPMPTSHLSECLEWLPTRADTARDVRLKTPAAITSSFSLLHTQALIWNETVAMFLFQLHCSPYRLIPAARSVSCCHPAWQNTIFPLTGG